MLTVAIFSPPRGRCHALDSFEAARTPDTHRVELPGQIGIVPDGR